MAQPKATSQAPARRIENVREVVLGFSKKQSLEESRRCPQCAQPTCLGLAGADKNPCPLGIDIPGFIRLLREDDACAALARIRRENPFPAVCGRICPAPCEDACIFYEDGAPIAIRSLERYAADFGRAKMNKDKDAKEIDVGRKVAIIGAGPAGMAAAYFLAQAGWTVAMFEAMNEPGGLLRYGVPEFRLPQSVIDEQVAELKDMGVKIHTNVFVGGARPIREILSQDYAAVLLTVGAGLPQLSDIPGHNLAGVYYAEEFLMRTQLNAKNKVAQEGLAIMRGPKVAVIGSGAGALDSARVALRLGKEVDLIFDGLEEELGVGAGDLSAGIEEGLRVHVPVQVKAVEGDADGFVRAVVCQRLEMIEKDDKLILEPVPDGMETIETQTIIFSFGRKPNSFLRHELPQLKWHDNGALWIDPLTGLTKMEKIFAAGNVTTGAGPVVDAIASGKSAAQKIIMGAQGTVP